MRITPFAPRTPYMAVLAASRYLVIANNRSNLLARYPLLSVTNTIGNFRGVSSRALDAVDALDIFVRTNTPALSGSISNFSLFTEKLNRVTLELPGNPLGLQRNDLVIEQSDSNRTALLLANIGGSSLCSIDVAGRFGRELSAQGSDAMVAPERRRQGIGEALVRTWDRNSGAVLSLGATNEGRAPE